MKSIGRGPAEMAAINALALEPLEPDDVYTFSVVACDNEIDRACERFDDAALADMARLYMGKTVIFDHALRSANQCARIYAASVEDAGALTSYGAPLKQLVVECYMLDNEANAALVADIKAGIKKEVSVHFSPRSVRCSVCGHDQLEAMCRHYPGREYDGQACHFVLGDIADCYELSFVAVPCQPGAGTRKDYSPEFEPDDGDTAGGGQEKDEEAPEGAFFMAKALAVAEAEIILRKER